MRTLRAVLIFSILATSAVTMSQPSGGGTMNIPAGGPLWKYFSGTNAQATAHGQVGPVCHAILILECNGIQEVVNEFISDHTNHPLSMGLNVVFDSSHFPVGSEVTVKYKIWVHGDPLVKMVVSPPIPVKNRAIIYKHPDFSSSDCVTWVMNAMANKNYALAPQDGGTWSAHTYLSDLNETNAAFCATHGATLNHWSGLNQEIRPGYDMFYMWNYGLYRRNQIGAVEPEPIAFPPPCNNGAPPINFLHLNACRCGNTSAWTEALYPQYWLWSSVPEDQAVLAYKPWILVDDLSSHANIIWTPLMAEQEIGEIVDEIKDLIVQGQLFLRCYRTLEDSQALTNLTDMVGSDWSLFGDTRMKLKGVYLGTGWKRPG